MEVKLNKAKLVLADLDQLKIDLAAIEEGRMQATQLQPRLEARLMLLKLHLLGFGQWHVAPFMSEFSTWGLVELGITTAYRMSRSSLKLSWRGGLLA